MTARNAGSGVLGLTRLLVRSTAFAAKRARTLPASERALPIELLRTARTTHREVDTAILAELLTRSATFLVPRPR